MQLTTSLFSDLPSGVLLPLSSYCSSLMKKGYFRRAARVYASRRWISDSHFLGTAHSFPKDYYYYVIPGLLKYRKLYIRDIMHILDNSVVWKW